MFSFIFIYSVHDMYVMLSMYKANKGVVGVVVVVANTSEVDKKISEVFPKSSEDFQS